LVALGPACSRLEPKPQDTALAAPRSAKPEETGNARQAAEEACKAETKRRGIASLIGIVSRLRSGAAEEDYVACMKQRGYEVKP
jgi:hypothetical protein